MTNKPQPPQDTAWLRGLLRKAMQETEAAILAHLNTRQEEKLHPIEEEVLAVLYSNEEYCLNYWDLESKTGIERRRLGPIIKHLKELDYIEFWRGLMTEDGEVAGAGWCRSRKGNDYVREHKL